MRTISEMSAYDHDYQQHKLAGEFRSLQQKQHLRLHSTPNNYAARAPTTSSSYARQQAQAQIDKVMSQFWSGSARLRQQAGSLAQSSPGASLLRSGRPQYKRLVEQQLQPNQQPSAKCPRQSAGHIQSLMSRAGQEDPTLLRWLQELRFEPELEPLALQARSCAHDEHTAGAISIRYSHIAVQESRQESSQIMELLDRLIDGLPLDRSNLQAFFVEFSNLYARLMKITSERTVRRREVSLQKQQPAAPLTVTYTTPRNSQALARSLQTLDRLTVQIRNLCLSYECLLNQFHEQPAGARNIDNALLEAQLRKLKELFGRFMETYIKAECRNIVHGLRFDFSQFQLARQTSDASLRPVRPFESSNCQLPLKYALIALWQLTRDDSYICRLLTERLNQASLSFEEEELRAAPLQASSPGKRLDYSTKHEPENNENNHYAPAASLQHSDYQRLCELTNRKHCRPEPASGALKSALRSKEPLKEASTIELLMEIIISQPNKHERLDMLNYIHTAAYGNQQQLVEAHEWQRQLSAAIYTSNHYKVAALRILNHLCTNEQAVKTILRCLSTPPPAPGQNQPMPENKIIRSIFECHQTSQEHIYQNETVFESVARRSELRGAKRSRKEPADDYSDYSDYGSKAVSSSAATGELELELAGEEPQAEQEQQEAGDEVVLEAIRLIVQLTSFFHRSSQSLDFYTLVGRFSIESLVRYLTNIIKSSQSREMVLLALSALANISFVSVEPMKLFASNGVILEMFRSNKWRSRDLELRDQAVTVLANTADKNLMEVLANGGLTFLLSCLESCPTRMANYAPRNAELAADEPASSPDHYKSLDPLEERLAAFQGRPRRDRKPIDLGDRFLEELECVCDEQYGQPARPTGRLCSSRLSQQELAAMERIHQKAAVAFARMSTDASTMRIVLEFGGLKQLIELCKYAQKRNHSDTVLIACIAALRKMAKVIERETFKHYNALDLIELDFDKTLEIYGNPRGELVFASDV